jgi:hypothetical protein
MNHSDSASQISFFSDSTTFLFGNNLSLIGLFPGPQHSFNSNRELKMADNDIQPQGLLDLSLEVFLFPSHCSGLAFAPLSLILLSVPCLGIST